MTPAPVRPLLLILVLTSFGLRIWQLPSLPPGLNLDEGFYALDALAAISGEILPFYPQNGGRESLFMLIAAPFVAVLGRDPLAIRLPSVLFGVLTVAATYAFATRLFRQSYGDRAPWVGLIAAALTATSLWFVLFTRIGLRINLFPFTLAVAGYWFWRAIESRRLVSFAVAGLAFGLVQYTYSAARILPAILPGALVVQATLARDLGVIVGRWRLLLVYIAFATLAMAPLLGYAATHPEAFFRRQAVLSPLNESRNPQSPGERYLAALSGTLPMFVVRGDERVYRNLPGKPVFDLLMAPFFLLGIGLASWRLRQPSFQFALVWLGVMTLATAVPLGVVPHNAHAFGLIPIVFFFPALGLVDFVGWVTRRGLPVMTAGLLVGGLVVGSGVWSTKEYFVDWAARPETYFQFDGDMVELAAEMNERDSPDTAFVIPISRLYREDYHHATVTFLYRGTAPYRFVRIDDERVPASLASLVGNRRTVVRMERLQSRDIPPDHNHLVDFLLRRQGHLLNEEPREGYRISTYRLDEPLLPALTDGNDRPGGAKFGAMLALDGWSAGANGRLERLWATLRWRSIATVRGDLKASVRLYDPDGRLVALADRELLRDPLFEPTSAWSKDDQSRTYHLLELPVGLAPGRYQVAVVVYDPEANRQIPAETGVEVMLGPVDLAGGNRSVPTEMTLPAQRTGDVSLTGRQLLVGEVRRGDRVPVVLLWRSEVASARGGEVSLVALDERGRELAATTAPIGPSWHPAERWPVGVPVRQEITLAIPLSAELGDITIEARLPNGVRVQLGEAEIVAG